MTDARLLARAASLFSEAFETLSLALADDSQPSSSGAQAVGSGRVVVAPIRPDEPEWLPPLADEPHDPVDEAPRAAKPVAQLADQVPQGSLAVCPLHKKPFTEGKFGPYCTQLTDKRDRWGKAKPDGKWFCAINARNVHEYMQETAGVPA